MDREETRLIVRVCARVVKGNGRRVGLTTVACTCGLLGVLALTTTTALAARGHVFAGEFGSQGTGNGQFEEPQGVAVNEANGDVYVADRENKRVERFSSAGVFESEITGFTAATGTGPLIEGESYIEPLTVTNGAFSEGQEISGPGLAPGTVITAVGTGYVEFFPPATASEPETTSFSAHQSLSSPEGIAVDNSCHLQKLSGVACSVADPSDEDVYVIDGRNAINKFSATGTYIGQLTGTCSKENESQPCSGGTFIPFNEVRGLGVDPKGELWVYYENKVANFGDTLANVFGQTREVQLGAPEQGFAVDSKDNLYVVHEANEFVAKLNTAGEVLNNAVGEEGAVAIAVEASSDDVYIRNVFEAHNVGTVSRFTSEGSLVESLGAGILQTQGKAGVAVNASTETVYVAETKPANKVVIFAPEPPGKPTVEASSVSTVTSTSATFEAQVTPRGAPTEYRFEYGPCATPTTCASSPYESSAPVPDGQLSPDFEPHAVTVEPEGLLPHTTYHFRVVAHNSHAGTGEGEELTFTTQASGAELSLPDNRAWELVSPPDKHGALISHIGFGEEQAAAQGGAITYATLGPVEEQTAGRAVVLAGGISAWLRRLVVAGDGQPERPVHERRGGHPRTRIPALLL